MIPSTSPYSLRFISHSIFNDSESLNKYVIFIGYEEFDNKIHLMGKWNESQMPWEYFGRKSIISMEYVMISCEMFVHVCVWFRIPSFLSIPKIKCPPSLTFASVNAMKIDCFEWKRQSYPTKWQFDEAIKCGDFRFNRSNEISSNPTSYIHFHRRMWIKHTTTMNDDDIVGRNTDVIYTSHRRLIANWTWEM